MDKFPTLRFFDFAHLPLHMREISEPFAKLAYAMAERDSNHPQEVNAGLRKLLEAKDCAVRAALD